MPKVELIGVYQLPVTDQLIAEQTELVYGTKPSSEAISHVRKQLASTVLVEVLVSDADSRFKVSDFTQPDGQLPPENWQVAWAEAFLSADGQRLMAERWDSAPAGLTSFRVAFYIHFYKAGEPLLSSYGSLTATLALPMPERLAQLVPYELVE